jgi:hypothetical protein
MKSDNFIIKNKVLLIALSLIIVLFVFFIQKKPYLNEDKVNNDTDISSWKGYIIEDSYTKIQENPIDLYTTFDIEYPSFKQADFSFNKKIQDLVKKQTEEHREISKENWQILFADQNDNIVDNVPTEEEKFYFFVDFVLTQSNPDYISFILKFSGFSGGAHGYENYVSFNYDVRNKKELEIDDLFSDDFDYLNFLSLRSREILKNRFAIVNEEDKVNYAPEMLEEYLDSIVSSIEDGTGPEKENFSVFTFLPNKIKIYFAQYQVGPYVIGMPEIEVERE